MHGHWLKGYLRDGKEIEGGGGGSGGEGPLLVNIVYEDPAAEANKQKTPARIAAPDTWLDATSLDIFAAAQTRGVVVYDHFDGYEESPAFDAYSPLSVAVRLETNGAVTYQFTCLVAGNATDFFGAADAYPKNGKG